MGIRDAFIFPLSPPPIPELGAASGFSFRLQDRAGLGHDALLAARNQLLGMASPEQAADAGAPDGLEDAPQLQVDIDRDKASRAGRGFRQHQRHHVHRAGIGLRQRLPQRRPPAARGGAGRCAGTHAARRPAALTPATQGQPVPLSAFATTRWVKGAMQTVRYNGYPAMRIRRQAAPGYSTGAAMAEMERWRPAARRLRLRVDRHLARREAGRLTGPGAVRLCHPGRLPVPGRAVRKLVHPLGGDLVVPLGVLGVVLATLRGYANDVYFQVG
jgi:multidrug efflux pump